MTNPYPLPRTIRQTDILLGDDGTTYGPFAGFAIWDIEDVEVWTKRQDAVRFTQVAATVEKVNDQPFDFFTIDVPGGIAVTTQFVVRSARLHERTAGVINGTQLSPTALEKELSKQGTVLQEMRRELSSRVVFIDFDGSPLTIDANIADGEILMKQGNRLVRGPVADQIAAAQFNAEAASLDAGRAEAARNAALSAVPNAFPVDRPALKLLETATITSAFLKEPGREGQFVWNGGDLSSIITPSSGTSTAVIGDELTIAGHGWHTGDAVYPTSSVNGLTAETFYWVIRVDDNTIKLAASFADTRTGTAVALTGSSAVTLVQHIDPNENIYVISDGGSFDGSDGAWVASGFSTSSLRIYQISDPGTWQASGPAGIPCKSGFTIRGDANSIDMPDVGVNVSMFTTVDPVSPSDAYKIGLAAWVEARTQTAHLYGGNVIVHGYGGPGNGLLTGLEANVNNLGTNSDDITPDGAVYGFVAAGVGNGRMTGAYWATGLTEAAEWNYGFIGSGYCRVATFLDLTDATLGMQIGGSHTTGIEMSGSTLVYAMNIPNNAAISAKDNTGTLREIIKLRSDNLLSLGQPGGIAGVLLNSNIQPAADNAFSLGVNGGRFTAVWAANGTVQTSDPKLKKDMRPLGDVSSIIDAVTPITFTWIDGGSEFVEEEVEEEVPVTEPQTVMAVELQPDGTYREVPTQIDAVVMDEHPILDAEGNHLMEVKKGSPEARHPETGEVIRPATPDVTAPRYHRTPRMEMRKVKKLVPRAKPGSRTHWGWNADNVREAFENYGVDFGGYVVGEDGTKALRPDQLIPVLWAEVKALRRRVADLEG